MKNMINKIEIKEIGVYRIKNESSKINELKVNYIFHPRKRSEKTIRMIY